MRITALPLALGAALACAQPAAATVNSLTNLPTYFNGYYFGGATSFGQVHGVNFIAPSGATGAIQTVSTPVYAADTGPKDGDTTMICTGGVRCEQIGNVQFQYALWHGTYGRGLAINSQGAMVLGGFQLTDTTDTSSTFSFLQTYVDSYNPGGVIDGGVYNGKTNGQIPYFQPNPSAVGAGWNYTANSPQYQFFDVPFDVSPQYQPEVVSFETALANTTAAGGVNVLADFTWSYSTLNGQLTGQQVTFNGSTSPMLLPLYAANYPGVSYTNGIVSPTGAVPEPAIWMMLLAGFSLLGAAARRRRELIAG